MTILIYPQAANSSDQTTAKRYSPRGKKPDETFNFAAKFTSNNEPHGLDNGPALNHWYCRDCGLPVPSNRATCANCTQVDGSLIIGGQS